MIYSLGGGWGHLMRALALARVVIPTQPVEILCNSPYLETIYRSHFWRKHFQDHAIRIHHLSPAAKLEQAHHWIAQVLSDRDLSYLIVDTFPRGLIGELGEILPKMRSIPKIWIHRDLNPLYVERYDLRSFVRHHYQHVLTPGDLVDPPLADLGLRTAPWLIANAEDLPPRESIRADLQVFDPDIPPNTPLILICVSGQVSEQPIYGELTQQISARFPQISVRCLAAEPPPGCPVERWICHWPGIQCLWAADLVVGGAGYHTIQECIAVGTPLIALPWQRIYDRQRLRLQVAQRSASIPIQAAQTIQEVLQAIETFLKIFLKDSPPQPRSRISYPNGAIEAARILRQGLISNEMA